MRNLIYIPTAHSPEERILSIDDPNFNFNVNVNALDEKSRNLWEAIERGIINRNLDYQKVRLFSEGVTSEPSELIDFARQISPRVREIGLEAIIRDLELSGIKSPQARLVLGLIAKGASVEIGEDTTLHEKTKLKLKEMAEMLSGKDPDEDVAGEELIKLMQLAREISDLGVNRDKHFAEAINGSLKEDETGILIIGSKHEVQSFLSHDIRIDDLSLEVRELAQEIDHEVLGGLSVEEHVNIVEQELRRQDINLEGNSGSKESL